MPGVTFGHFIYTLDVIVYDEYCHALRVHIRWLWMFEANDRGSELIALEFNARNSVCVDFNWNISISDWRLLLLLQLADEY